MIVKRLNNRARNLVSMVLVFSLTFLNNCLHFTRSKYQTYPVISNPGGVKLIVNGIEAGITPLPNLKLNRVKDHIIRLEKEGFRPVEILVKSKLHKEYLVQSIIFAPLFVSFCVVIGTQVHLGKSYDHTIIDPYGAILGGVIGLAFVPSYFSRRATHALSPEYLLVKMEPAEKNSEPDKISMTIEQFEKLRYIHVSLVE